MADQFIWNRISNTPYPAIGMPLCLHGRGAERLDHRAPDAYPGERPRAGTLEPVAVSIGPRYGTSGPFRPPGATATRGYALLAWERGMAACVAGFEGTCHA